MILRTYSPAARTGDQHHRQPCRTTHATSHWPVTCSAMSMMAGAGRALPHLIPSDSRDSAQGDSRTAASYHFGAVPAPHKRLASATFDIGRQQTRGIWPQLWVVTRQTERLRRQNARDRPWSGLIIVNYFASVGSSEKHVGFHIVPLSQPLPCSISSSGRKHFLAQVLRTLTVKLGGRTNLSGFS